MSEIALKAVRALLTKVNDEEQPMTSSSGNSVMAVPTNSIRLEIDEVDRLVGQLERFAIQNNLDEALRAKRFAEEARRLEDSNKELLDALEDCCVIAKPENPPCCCPNYQPLPDGDCAEAKNGDCHIWKAIQKERGKR